MDARVVLDAVCGDLLGKIVDWVPFGTKIVIYGGLGGDLKNIKPFSLMFKSITIKTLILGMLDFMNNEKKFK